MGGFEAAGGLLRDAYAAVTSADGAGAAASLLAWVFLLSGTVKLRRPALAALAMVDFGVARKTVPALGLALGAVEVMLGAALLLRVFPGAALVVAGVLLTAFAAVIARAVARGDSFPCFCFGDAEGSISWWTFARTAALAALAVVLVAGAPAELGAGGTARSLQEVVALSVLGSALLAARIPRLVRWNAVAMKVLRSAA